MMQNRCRVSGLVCGLQVQRPGTDSAGCTMDKTTWATRLSSFVMCAELKAGPLLLCFC